MKADIFFFVTTIAVVLLSLVGLLALGFMVSILHQVRNIAARTRTEVEDILDDLHDVRKDIKAGVGTARKGVEAVSAYAKTVRKVKPMGVLSLLLETIRELRSSSYAEEEDPEAPRRRRGKKSNT